MSYDDVVARLRDELVRGAHYRRRSEKRHRVMLAGVTVVFGLLLVGGVLWARGDTGSEITAGPGSGSDVVAACDALLDVHSALTFRDEQQLEPSRARFGELAASSGDDALAALGQGVESGDFDSYAAATERCRELEAPGFNPRLVPATMLGPVPTVSLADYGMVQELEAFDGDARAQLTKQIMGRNLSVVEAARTAAGGYIARWSYDDPDNGRLHCYLLGGPDGMASGCAPNADLDERSQANVTGSMAHPVVFAFPTSDVSFLVLETPTGAYVQRPASGIAVFALDLPTSPNDRIRSYDPRGNELACGPIRDPQPC